MENYYSNDKYKSIELKNVNKEIIPWIENIVMENNSRVERKEWKASITAMLSMITNRFVPKVLKLI